MESTKAAKTREPIKVIALSAEGAVEVLEKQYKLVYTFEALDPPPGFTPGFPLDV